MVLNFVHENHAAEEEGRNRIVPFLNSVLLLLLQAGAGADLVCWALQGGEQLRQLLLRPPDRRPAPGLRLHS